MDLEPEPPWRPHRWQRDPAYPIMWTVLTDHGDPDGDRDVLDLMGEAEANLLAAAPELYEACKAALSNLDRLTEIWGSEGVTRSVADKLRAAVAKAEGGA